MQSTFHAWIIALIAIIAASPLSADQPVSEETPNPDETPSLFETTYVSSGDILFPGFDFRYASGDNQAENNARYRTWSAALQLPFVTGVDWASGEGISPTLRYVQDRFSYASSSKEGHHHVLTFGLDYWGVALHSGTLTPVLRRASVLFFNFGVAGGFTEVHDVGNADRDEGFRIETHGRFGAVLAELSACAAQEVYSNGDRFDEFDASINIPKPISPVAISVGFRYQHGLGFTMRGWLIGFEISF
ncbi:MAG: hypothetical protein HUU29_01680 [Planctomycetaceae bacterium]|nr:hypothetical protein [Planctomycetaceae bacterium]